MSTETAPIQTASTRPAPSRLPEGLYSLADHESHAQGLMDAAIWAYLNGGAADEITLRANISAWQQMTLQTRVLRSMQGAHTQVKLLGKTWEHPILVAPMAYQCLAHPHGEQATALASAALGAGMVLSMQSSTSLDVVAKLALSDAGRGPLWFQLYLQSDRGLTKALVRQAEAAGFEALVVTVDAPVQGPRDRERRAGFQMPSHVRAVNLDGFNPPAPPVLQPGQSPLFDGHFLHAPTWDDIEWLREVTHLPLLLKGITHPDDARLAMQAGAAGVIVSNHGGRILDTVPPSATLLPAVVQALHGDLPVLVDGGIRRGTDVLKAVGLGAAAVMVGRPVLHGLANAGAIGVAHVLRLLRDELEIAMALTGCESLASAADTLAKPAATL